MPGFQSLLYLSWVHSVHTGTMWHQQGHCACLKACKTEKKSVCWKFTLHVCTKTCKGICICMVVPERVDEKDLVGELEEVWMRSCCNSCIVCSTFTYKTCSWTISEVNINDTILCLLTWPERKTKLLNHKFLSSVLSSFSLSFFITVLIRPGCLRRLTVPITSPMPGGRCSSWE